MILVYNLRAKTRGKLKDYKGAIEDYLIVLNDRPDHGQTLFEIGVTYLHDDQLVKGENALRKAEKLGIQKATIVLNSIKE